MAPSAPPPVKALLFDLDGLLIDSEDLYTEITNTVLREYGKPDLPWRIKALVQGRPAPEATAVFNTWAQLPLSPSEYQSRLEPLQAAVFPRAQPLPGVLDLLTHLSTHHPTLPLALATSSHDRSLALKTSHLPRLLAHFPPPRRVLGNDPRVPRGRGKPAPDVFLVALRAVNASRAGAAAADVCDIRPEECLVFEDSVPGVEAARRAGMQAVWVPHPGLRKEYEGREGEVLAGRTGTLRKMGEDGGFLDEKEEPPEWAQVGDGWAVVRDDLVGFAETLETYGICREETN